MLIADTSTHVTVHHKRQTTEHLALSHNAASEQLPNTTCQFFIESHNGC